MACSPESARSRAGGAGADVGNVGSPIELHGRVNPSENTPKVGRAIAITK